MLTKNVGLNKAFDVKYTFVIKVPNLWPKSPCEPHVLL